MRKTYLFIISLLLIYTASAQTPDSLLKPSPVKTLTARQYDALMHGDDEYNMGAAATMNGLPDPASTLQHKKDLDLSPLQVTAITKINIELQRKKIEMGGFIVTNEKKLDNMFSSKKLNEGDIIFFTNRYGIYLGELRNAILQAAFSTYKLLSPQQVNKLRSFKK